MIGFESIISSTIETSETGEVSSLQSRIDGQDNIGHVVGDEGVRLGAIPKRRSPRHLALGNKVDGIERLTRIKTEKRNLNVEEDEGKLLTAVRSRFSMPDFDKFSIKKNLVKPPSQASKEGRENCDILRYIYEKNISHVLGIIYSCLAPKDLCQVAQVSF